MTLTALGFVLGAALLQQQATLPAPAWRWALPVVLALFLWTLLRRAGWSAWARAVAVPMAVALGFLWAAGQAQLRIDDRLAPELEGRDLVVVGVVSGLPAVGERVIRFDFEPERAQAECACRDVSGLPGIVPRRAQARVSRRRGPASGGG